MGLRKVLRLSGWRSEADWPYCSPMFLTLEIEREDDGRWLAEVPDLPGVLAYGDSRDQAVARVEALALRVLADRLEHGEAGPDLGSVSFRAA